jgi:hypothetical protein
MTFTDQQVQRRVRAENVFNRERLARLAGLTKQRGFQRARI